MAARKAGIVSNWLNLKRALAGKSTSIGGRRMSATARKQLISKATSAIGVNRDVTEAKAMQILRSRVTAGKNVGGFIKGAKKGASEGSLITATGVKRKRKRNFPTASTASKPPLTRRPPVVISPLVRGRGRMS